MHTVHGVVTINIVDYSKSELKFTQSNYQVSVVENITQSGQVQSPILTLSVIGVRLGEQSKLF